LIPIQSTQLLLAVVELEQLLLLLVEMEQTLLLALLQHLPLVVVVAHLMAAHTTVRLVVLVVAVLLLVAVALAHLDKVILAVIPTGLYLVVAAVARARLVRLV
jgi:hypothetical protein